MVLTFDRASIQHRIYNKIVDSLMESGCNVHQEVNKTFKELLPNIISKKQRQKELEIFARVVFAKAFNLPINQKQKHISDAKMENILKMELTSEEFGNLLNMRPDSIFVKLMFKLIVKDSNNYVSFGEFLNLLIIFAKGTDSDKANLLFDMYTINNENTLPMESFKNMILSFMENVNGHINNDDLKKNYGQFNKSSQSAGSILIKF